MLKNKKLAVQIWAMFMVLLAIIFLVLSLSFRYILDSFFINDLYKQMEDAQEQILTFEQGEKDFGQNRKQESVNNREQRIGHLHISTGEASYGMFPPFLNKEKILEQIQNQTEEVERYNYKDKETKVYYIIRILDDEYLVTYTSPEIQGQLTNELFNQLVMFMVILAIASFPFSNLLARRLTTPLIKIEQHVNDLANRNWDEPLLLDQKDEVGKLAASVEKLRKRLIKHDKKQQSFIQHMSHELKTPVMIIESYLHAIEDGIYPKGNLESSLQVVQSETERLKHRIQSILYLTKLNQMEVEKLNATHFDMQDIMYETIDKFTIQRAEVEWDIDMEDTPFYGDKEQILILFENLIQNQMRYAKYQIGVSMKKDDQHVFVQIENDGEQIPLESPNLIFEPFYKGEKGQYGLGLAIAKNIVQLHHGHIEVNNKEKGVVFTITFPLQFVME